jgi:hypothetical protein
MTLYLKLCCSNIRIYLSEIGGGVASTNRVHWLAVLNVIRALPFSRERNNFFLNSEVTHFSEKKFNPLTSKCQLDKELRSAAVKDYHSTLCHIPEERRSHQRRGGSLKS